MEFAAHYAGRRQAVREVIRRVLSVFLYLREDHRLIQFLLGLILPFYGFPQILLAALVIVFLVRTRQVGGNEVRAFEHRRDSLEVPEDLCQLIADM